MSRRKPLLFLLSMHFAVLFPLMKVFSLTVEDITEQLHEKYASFKDVKMEFVENISSDVFEDKRECQGEICLKNPDKFKITTHDQTIVTNGEHIWVYSRENRQVTEDEFDPRSGTFLPYRYLTSFKEDYEAKLGKDETVRKRSCHKLILTAKEENNFISKMIMWVDKESWLTLKLRYWDSSENEITFLFKNIRIDSQIDDSAFVFKIPPGVELLDLSK